MRWRAIRPEPQGLTAAPVCPAGTKLPGDVTDLEGQPRGPPLVAVQRARDLLLERLHRAIRGRAPHPPHGLLADQAARWISRLLTLCVAISLLALALIGGVWWISLSGALTVSSGPAWFGQLSCIT